MALKATRIDHVNMTVKDLDATLAFYQKLFGFTIRKDQHPSYESYIIGNDDIKLCLYEDKDLVVGEGLNHFGFHVDNFDEIVATCKQMGVEMPYGVVEWEEKKSRSVYIVDPSGYEIELSEIQGGAI